jgi:hypothetical protein
MIEFPMDQNPLSCSICKYNIWIIQFLETLWPPKYHLRVLQLVIAVNLWNNNGRGDALYTCIKLAIERMDVTTVCSHTLSWVQTRIAAKNGRTIRLVILGHWQCPSDGQCQCENENWELEFWIQHRNKCISFQVFEKKSELSSDCEVVPFGIKQLNSLWETIDLYIDNSKILRLYCWQCQWWCQLAMPMVASIGNANGDVNWQCQWWRQLTMPMVASVGNANGDVNWQCQWWR